MAWRMYALYRVPSSVMLCYVMLCACMSKRVSHGNSSLLTPHPPEIIPYGKRSPRKNTIWQTYPRKKSHGRTSTGEKQYHYYGKASPSMLDLPPPHTHFLIREQIQWQIVPPEIIPYGKRSPRKNTIWQTYPRKKSHGRTSPGEKQYHSYGKASPSMVDHPPPHTHTHFLIREQIPWQIVPLEIIPHGKRSP